MSPMSSIGAYRTFVKLILTLTDYWNAYGGMMQYVAWDSLYGTDGHISLYQEDFFTDTDIRKWFKAFIKTMLYRINTITGIRYCDDPAIFAWELANEPRSNALTRNKLHNWLIEMSRYIKSLDSNHMVSVGLEGFYNKDTSDWKRDGSCGDFLYDGSIATLDFVTVHAWPDSWGLSQAETINWIQEHITDAHTVLKKPVIVEEIGKARDAGSLTTTRDALLQAMFNEVIARKAGGAMPWALYHDSYPDHDGFGIYYPQDASTAIILQNAASQMNSLSY